VKRSDCHTPEDSVLRVHHPGNAIFYTAVGLCVYSECVSIWLRWVLELFTFCERLGSEYQTGDGGHFFWVLCSRMLLGAGLGSCCDERLIVV
jgi:hypothetical protein